MRTGRVKVIRDRPSPVVWALALFLTMLMVYILTLSGQYARALRQTAPAERRAGGARVTKEIALEPLTLWCVRFGGYDTAEAARVEAARFTARGAAGYVLEADGTYLLLGAGYAQKAEAERVSERLAAEAGIEGGVVSREAGAVRLRITAEEGQIEEVVAVDAALRQYTEQMASLALRLDRAEIRSDAARTVLTVLAAQLRERLRVLKEIPGEDAVFRGLTAEAEALAAALEVLAHENAAPEAALSGKIKYAYIAARLGYIDFLRGLKK